MCVAMPNVPTMAAAVKGEAGPNGDAAEQLAKKAAKAVLGEYTKEMYVIDIVCFWVGAVLLAACAALMVPHLSLSIMPHVAVVSVLGVLTADVATGMVHWLADTYGTVDLPVIGKTLLRPFRYHHVDPVAMCRTSIYETSGSNHMAVSPTAVWLLLSLYDFKGAGEEKLSTFLYYVYFLVTLAFIAVTNLFHKWSHMYRTPKWINFLQATPFVISKAHHREHHVNPHDIYYCITCGLMNHPLEAIGFFRNMEKAIEKITGIGPRLDDGKWLKTTKTGMIG